MLSSREKGVIAERVLRFFRLITQCNRQKNMTNFDFSSPERASFRVRDASRKLMQIARFLAGAGTAKVGEECALN